MIDQHEIKELREALGLTQVQLAKMIGVSPCTVQAWEQGKRKPQPGAADRLVALRLIQDARWEGPMRRKQ